MSPQTVIWLLVAVVAGRMVQLYLTYQQSLSFNADVRRLRQAGTVSVGLGGRRYRGGRAFVAISVDERGVVRDALSLQGFTTFARGRRLGALVGTKVTRLIGETSIDGVSKPQRLAARQAAELYRDGTATTTSGTTSGTAADTGVDTGAERRKEAAAT